MSFFRTIIVGGMLTLFAAIAVNAQQRPPIGTFGSSPDAMIFYVAHGAADACGPGCSDWIAAEGAMQFDTYKRLIAILDRQASRKLPVVIHSSGASDLTVASSLGRILRDRGLDATAGITEVAACDGRSKAECFALKRSGGPLDAKLATWDLICDFACVLTLAGGVHRSLPPGTRVMLTGRTIRNRLAPNVSAEHREGLTEYYGDRTRKYLTEMGLAPDIIDIVDAIGERGRPEILPPNEWARMHIVTPP